MTTESKPSEIPSDQDPRWTAVVARDRAFDGKFYYSVGTTGVYCRPSCAARRARRENVRFHATCADAEKAGFRPCKRCEPDQPSLVEQHAAKIAAVCRRIASADDIPALDELARTAGLSTYHFHRVFKAVTGITPKAYAMAHRAERVREELSRSGTTVTEAIYGAGFNSSGRFYETADQALGMTPTDYRRRREHRDTLRRGRVLARFDSGCAEREGRVRHPARRRSRCTRSRPAGSLSPRPARRRRRGVRGARRQGRRLGRGTGGRLRPAARYPWNGIPATGVASAEGNPARRHGQLRGYRRADRIAQVDQGGGGGMRGVRDRRGNPLPSCRADRRRAVGLSLGRRAQAQLARPGARGGR